MQGQRAAQEATATSHPSRYYQAPDDLRKKRKATGFLSAKSYGHLWGNIFPAHKPSPILAPVVPGSVCPLVGLHLLTYINVLGKLLSEKSQLWDPGESPKCSQWVLAFYFLLCAFLTHLTFPQSLAGVVHGVAKSQT